MVETDKFIMRKPDNADVGLREDCEEDIVNVGRNTDLYVANQESPDSTREAHVGVTLGLYTNTQSRLCRLQVLS